MATRKGKSRRKARSKRTSLRWKLIKIATVLLAIPALVVLILLIRYYYVFSGLIEQKLATRDSQFETEIYAAPTLIYSGKPMQYQALLEKLRRLGYAERGSGKVAGVANYYDATKENQILIYNDGAARADAGRQVAVTFSRRAIRSIVDLKKRSELPSFALEPELLSVVINENREKRRFVAYRDLPVVLKNAILTAEDRRFFTHRGIDPYRIISALIVDLREGDFSQGASTLTQQFVKNYFLTTERTWKRKLSDAYMSILLEKKYSKEEIFEFYCNSIYLGQRGSFSIVGVGQATEAFFDKSVKDLTLGEAATLAGIITAPNRYAPHRYPDRAQTRRDLVLDQMAEDSLITAGERDAAKAKPLEIEPTSILNYSDAPYFVDYIQDILIDQFGDSRLASSRFKVHTTLDRELQQAAFEAMGKGLAEVDSQLAQKRYGIPPGTVQASLIALDPRNGHILAMIGGRNYGLSQFNRITQAKRQPGSIYKPFVYAAAMETAYYSTTPLTAASTILDERTQFTFDDLLYEPKNFKDEYMGQVTMRQAVARSLNISTIKFAEKVGYGKIADLAHRLKLNAQIKPYPSMAIGAFEVTPLELVRAYTAFANGGLLTDLTPITKIIDAQAKLIFEAKPQQEQVLKPEVAFMITSLMKSVVDNGTGAGTRARGFKLPAAGKTGTSHDGWFAGYTPELLCIVWVGFDDNRELILSGSQAALPIWTEFMKRAETLLPLKGEEFVVPEGVTQVEIDPSTGLLATERCLERRYEYFILGTEPALRCYGNSYEQMLSGGSPYNLYATPAAKAPGNGVDNKNESPQGYRKPSG